MDEYDYVIVGGGTAGLALASRLSQDPSVSVVVLESGFHNESSSVDIPALMGSEMGEGSDWNYSAVSNSYGDKGMPWPRGRVLGGSSALHFLCWSKASKEEYDAWEKMGNKDWNWETMSRCMRKAESYQPPTYTEDSLSHIHPSSDYGTDGLVKISFTSYISKLAQNWMKGLTSLGLPVNESPLAGLNIGASYHPASVDLRDNTRSYSISYLKGTESRTNLKIMTGCDADRVILSKEQDSKGHFKAQSVRYRHRGRDEELTIKASRDVILCAGSIESPAILERSGIGNREVLEKAGVESVIELEGVGENLQDHITISIANELKPGTDTIDALRANAAFFEAQQSLRASKGNSMLNSSVPTMSYLRLDDFLDPKQQSELLKLADEYLLEVELEHKSKSESEPNPSLTSLRQQVKNLKDYPNQVSQMEVIGLNFYRSIVGNPEKNKSYNTFVAAPQHLLSRGSSHIKDSNPTSKPLIEPRYFQDNGYDLKLSLEGTKFLRKLAATPPFQEYLEKEVSPGPQVQDEELEDFVLKSFKTEYHPIGTVAMLPREDGGVVDSNLKVYSTSNLKVCDAGIIPLHLATHPQATVYGIAERLAEIIKEERKMKQ